MESNNLDLFYQEALNKVNNSLKSLNLNMIAKIPTLEDIKIKMSNTAIVKSSSITYEKAIHDTTVDYIIDKLELNVDIAKELKRKCYL